MLRSVLIRNVWPHCETSFALAQKTSPSQYSLRSVFGVPPLSSFACLRIGPTSHPAGISPSSESSKRSGKRSAMSLGRPGSRPSALARTGSKSTNHDSKIDRIEDRTRHRLQRLVHPPIHLDLVV